MPSLQSSAALALLLLAAAPAASHGQTSHPTQRVERGVRVDPQLETALRHYGFDPYRLRQEDSYALDRTRTELVGTGRRALSRTQATAIVYMALVFPRESRDGRGGGGYGYGDGDGRGGYGQDNGAWGRDSRPGRCTEVEQQAYELGNVVSAPARDGLFVGDPEKSRARSLARTIQQGALQCGNRDAADIAGEIMEELAGNLPERSEVARRIAELKSALRGEPYRDSRPR